MLNSNFLTDGLTSINLILENIIVIYSYLDNYIILAFDIVIVGIIILFSGKAKKNYLIPFLTINKKNFFNLFKNKNFKFLPILGVISPENTSDITQFGYFVLGLSIIILWTLINVLGYLSAIHILSISNFESKYPKLLIFFKYFKYSSITFVVIQGIICIISVLTLIYISYLFINL